MKQGVESKGLVEEDIFLEEMSGRGVRLTR